MKKFVYILPLVAALFFTTACEDEDYRDPSTIVEDYMNEFHSILTSSDLGWRFDYFPNEEAYGAFTFMMNFRKDGRVEMLTDENFFYLFDEDRGAYEVQESDYTIQNSQGPVLTFATYSLLSKLADPELFNNGSGWQGDNEFVLMGHSADKDTVYLKSVRAQKRCFLVKNTEEWDEYFDRLNKVIKDFSHESVANNYFRDIILPDQEPAVMTGFDLISRMAVIYQYQGDKMYADSCQLLFTTEGVSLKRPAHLGQTVIRNFKYNNSSVFYVNGDENSTVQVAENGRPKITFKVRDKVFRGRYDVVQDGVTMEESDLYFINLNPNGSEDEWDELFKSLQNYLYMVMIPDDSGVYYVDLYDQIVNESGQSNVVLARCSFIHQWSYTTEDEIVFRGVSNSIAYMGTDSESGDYEQNTPLALQFRNNVSKTYPAYLKSLFGNSSRDRINCIVVPSVDEQEFYFVNIEDGSYLGIMRI